MIKVGDAIRGSGGVVGRVTAITTAVQACNIAHNTNRHALVEPQELSYVYRKADGSLGWDRATDVELVDKPERRMWCKKNYTAILDREKLLTLFGDELGVTLPSAAQLSFESGGNGIVIKWECDDHE